jgi:putative SOS response-associated peptidase YedK
MRIRVGKKAKEVLLSINMEKYCQLMNDLYKLQISQSIVMIENERRSADEVMKLINKYFPGVLKEYELILFLEDPSFKDPKYFLTLRKKIKYSK